ncbi:putative retinoblastoma-binding protein [Phaeomoniella chlamydospora]|uniref:Putative retinoblastoma-binding protein n=1 Tax=Phaeomoniella chlamydospora TaxID=158046 RepID=A0A0G2EQL9_PHACM|nr:putative retinoblastoma-binding protein [Phaeomoniella chlamydospora]
MLMLELEYDDDTTIIPRSTSVLARRLPANKPGKGGAARYVSGRAPVKALGGPTKLASTPASNNADLSSAQTEEERMRAIMGLEAQNWEQEKQQMATQQKVFYGKPNQMKAANVPEGEPPHGYVCYRCGQKGHWIQACPTNSDPNFKGPVKIKRTTGIPRSFLTKVEKPKGDGTDLSELQGVMVNADGDFVIAHSDEKTWKQYQEKQKQAAEAQMAVASNKELQNRGIECPIDKRMFVEPMKTPCCGRTYCGDCITNALIENDLVCPGCSTDGVLIDNLVEDTDAKEKIKEYEAWKLQQKAEEPQSPAVPAVASPTRNGHVPVDIKSPRSPRSPSSQQNNSKFPSATINGEATTSKKRSADEAAEPGSPTTSTAPIMKRQKSSDSTTSRAEKKADEEDKVEATITSQLAFETANTETHSTASSSMPQQTPQSLESFMPPDFTQMMTSQAGNVSNATGFPNMPSSFPGMPNMNMPFPMPGMPNMNGMNGMNMNMNMGMNMGMPMMNPMMMAGMMGMQGNPMGMPRGMNGMNGMSNGWNNGNQHNGNNWNNQQHPQQQQNHYGTPKFPNQQRSGGAGMNNGMNGFNGGVPAAGGTLSGGDSPYMRQPVNPHRHLNRGKRVRPSDYREL